MSNVPLLPFTVILAGADDSADAVTYYHVEALDSVDAGNVAMRKLYDEQHIGWDNADLRDDPFCYAMFEVLYVFAGHHVNLTNR